MANHTIQRGRDVVSIALTGRFEEEDAKALFSELSALRLGASVKVVFDLRGLQNCTIMGRAGLMDAQRHLMKLGARTAWISDKPRFRGTALWVVREVDDENAGVCRDDDQAAEWLDSTEKRREMKVQRFLAWAEQKS